MTLTTKTLLLMALWLIFAALLIYLASLIAGRVTGVSGAENYNIYVRSSSYWEVER